MSDFDLPTRVLDDFNWKAVKDIQKYCRENYSPVECPVAVDVCISAYQKWLAKNGFQIIDRRNC